DPPLPQACGQLLVGRPVEELPAPLPAAVDVAGEGGAGLGRGGHTSAGGPRQAGRASRRPPPAPSPREKQKLVFEFPPRRPRHRTSRVGRWGQMTQKVSPAPLTKAFAAQPPDISEPGARAARLSSVARLSQSRKGKVQCTR